MKLKTIISGFQTGKIVKFRHTFETPDFEDRFVEVAGHRLKVDVINQQNNWLDDNYHLVIEECENRDIYPIINFEVVPPRNKRSKKDEVLDILEACSPNMSPETMAMTLGTLHELWPNVKTLAPEKILYIVFSSLSASAKIGSALLKGITDILDGTGPKRLDEKNHDHRNQGEYIK